MNQITKNTILSVSAAVMIAGISFAGANSAMAATHHGMGSHHVLGNVDNQPSLSVLSGGIFSNGSPVNVDPISTGDVLSNNNVNGPEINGPLVSVSTGTPTVDTISGSSIALISGSSTALQPALVIGPSTSVNPAAISGSSTALDPMLVIGPAISVNPAAISGSSTAVDPAILSNSGNQSAGDLLER